MSGNLENDRSVTAGKMYPIDLAPQKITIVKSVSNAEVKMAHLIPGQTKTAAAGQIITHTGPVGLMRPVTQILTPGITTQPQMIVSGPPILQGTQIVSQGSQIIGQSSQIISQSQIISPSGQILSPGTQIISQGTQLSAQVSNTGSNVQMSVPSSVSGAQVLSVGGQLVSGAQALVSTANLVVSSSVRTLPPSVRVMPPLPHHNTRPAVLSTVNVGNTGGVLVSKGVTSHVPRGIAAGASLAVRPVNPSSAAAAIGSQGSWSAGNRCRGTVVYNTRAPRATPPSPGPTPLPTTTVLTSSGVISGTVRASTPRPNTPTSGLAVAPRPMPLLQRNYQPAKVVGVASVGVRGMVGNSAPAQLYYEVPRAAPPACAPALTPALTPALAPALTPALAPAHHLSIPNQPLSTPQTLPTSHTLPTSQNLPTTPNLVTQNLSTPNLAHSLQQRPLTPYVLSQPAQVSIVNTAQHLPEARQPTNSVSVSVSATPVLARPTILRKRDIEGSPTKAPQVLPYRNETWEDIPSVENREGSGGSTTISASSSPAPDDEPEPPRIDDLSPRKKPRKQMLSNEIRQCQEFQTEEQFSTPPRVPANPPPKRPQLSSSYVCGWRSTAMHFTRPTDVKRREPRPKDILAIASQKHVLTSAEGWKVHHLTAQMDDLVSLEADVGSQLTGVLKTLEGAGARALSALQPHSHTLLELLKGNIQRSKIVCEGIQEAREDILRVFTHRNFVAEILTRQADKRCFRKHRSQS